MKLDGRGFALLMLATACGGSSSTSIPDPAPLTGTPCEQYAQARCAKQQSCTNGVFITRDFGDASTCIARETLSCNDGLAAPGAGQTSALVEQCAQGMSSYSCTDFLDSNLPAECSPTGPGPIGAACTFGNQCQTGFCGGARTAICGTCAAPPAAGDSCATSGCAHNQACIIDEGTKNLCEPYVANGSACGPFNNPNCAADLTCVGASTTNMTGGTCAPAVGVVGAACGSKNAGIFCDFRLGLSCSSDDTCVSITTVSDGMPCGYLAGGLTQCTGGACYSAGSRFITYGTANATGTCKAYAADGAACDTQLGPECMSGARCVIGDAGTAGICTLPTPALSSACH